MLDCRLVKFAVDSTVNLYNNQAIRYSDFNFDHPGHLLVVQGTVTVLLYDIASNSVSNFGIFSELFECRLSWVN